ncbi:transcriptional regulator family: Fungal Specific TF [Penicillium roqueforti]|nr:transcriptional regulator family: Fungal Specific TF [Penicillium roqueforti]KAI3172895.1 transcriptional regulator family: Fungal Specific TF [Penicillium roqueforti]KAI3173187.1 transcriptional regulator family: Fungal Specific TF [Penicillium roqueforti]KAI3242469.1 transcriptional regulator family: Fungal Specific TF [Penicillium roqueforti]KAI3269325.1 transcriptional regulator family: Fungal Specific TF [Penicillium roqueforti]
MADPVGQVGTTHSRSSAPRVRLTCEACRQRKVKCDKLSPCTSCQRLGLVCIPVERARLPRGRARKPERIVGSDKELSERVARLEKLLKIVANERGDESHISSIVHVPSHSSTQQESVAEASTTGPDTHQDHDYLLGAAQPHLPRPSTAYVGGPFWEDIMQQTQELRSVLEDRLENENHDIKDSASGFGVSVLSSESPDSSSNSPQANSRLNLQPQIRHRLCDIFFRNVDPLFKILHRPSLQAFIRDGKPYLDYEQDHQAPATLASAIYLCAVCTLDEVESQSMFNTSKKIIVAEFQKETESALAKADFVTTNDLTVLQAYIISLLAARSQDQSRRVWTMLSMALRVGQALSLHMPQPPFTVRPFEHEMRKRAWLGIGLLDVAASLDRASEPMMQSAWLDYNPPLNINDEDLWFDMTWPISEHTEGTFTDMTHTLVSAAAASVTRTLAFSDVTEPAVTIMSLRQQVVHDFQQKTSVLLGGCRPDLSDFQWYAQKTACLMGSWLQLACLRPLQRSYNFIPPKIQENALLKIAADNLQCSQEVYNHPGSRSWRWYQSMWVPWHALAVALAELCVCKSPTVMSKYWTVVEDVYHRSRLVIADSQQGMLWKPLERLMSQAKTQRNQLLGIDASRQEYSFDGISPELFSEQSERQQDLTNFSLDLREAVDGPRDSHVAEVPTSFAPVPWPNVWDAMDFSDPTLQSSSDDTAWLSYENFIDNVYDSVDSIFLPR